MFINNSLNSCHFLLKQPALSDFPYQIVDKTFVLDSVNFLSNHGIPCHKKQHLSRCGIDSRPAHVYAIGN